MHILTTEEWFMIQKRLHYTGLKTVLQKMDEMIK